MLPTFSRPINLPLQQGVTGGFVTGPMLHQNSCRLSDIKLEKVWVDMSGTEQYLCHMELEWLIADGLPHNANKSLRP